MRLLPNYDIKRMSLTRFIVTEDKRMIAEFSTYKQAEDFLFNMQADALVVDLVPVEAKVAA